MSRAVDEVDLIEPDRLAEAVIDDVIAEAQRPPDKRRRMTIREMRTAIEVELQLVCVAASNIAAGIALTPEDIHRVWAAKERVLWIWDEGLR